MLLLSVGVQGVYTFVVHVFFPAYSAEHIGWAVSPFQFEVGIADLTVGVLGLIAFWSNFSFRVAAAIAAIVWYGGDAIGHVRQMIIANNYAPGNAGSWFWTDVLVPIVLIVSVLPVWRRATRSTRNESWEVAVSISCVVTACLDEPRRADEAGSGKPLPAELQAVLDKPLYKNGVWGLRVVDLDTGEVIYDLEPNRKFMTGSVRKLISVGLALDKLGADHTFETPIYWRGTLKNGVLDGDLILVASGDLVDGRTNESRRHVRDLRLRPQRGEFAGQRAAHRTDPLAGYAGLAKQVAGAGIHEVHGRRNHRRPAVRAVQLPRRVRRAADLRERRRGRRDDRAGGGQED